MLIGEELTLLVDEAFKHHRLERETPSPKDYFDWAEEFNVMSGRIPLSSKG